MAKSCQQLVVEKALERLETIPAVETAEGAYQPVKVELNRRIPLTEDDLPSIVLFKQPAVPLNDFSSEDAYDQPFVVQGAVKGSGAVAEEFANTLEAECIKALFTDRTLGGRVRMLELSDTGDFLGAEVPAETEGFMFGFRVHYATREGDPFTFE